MDKKHSIFFFGFINNKIKQEIKMVLQMKKLFIEDIGYYIGYGAHFIKYKIILNRKMIAMSMIFLTMSFGPYIMIYLYDNFEIDGKIIRFNRVYGYYDNSTGDMDYIHFPSYFSRSTYEEQQNRDHPNISKNFIQDINTYTDSNNQTWHIVEDYYWEFGESGNHSQYCDTFGLYSIVQHIENKYLKTGDFSDLDVVQSILSAVQPKDRTYSIKYLSERNNYVKYPIETLVEGGGDCEDLSILFCSLCKCLEYETLLISIRGHVYAAVSFQEQIDDVSNLDYFIDGNCYFHDISYNQVSSIVDDKLYLYFNLNSSTILMNSERSEIGLHIFYLIHDYYKSSNSSYVEENYDFYLSNAKFVLNGKIFYPVECTSYDWKIGEVYSGAYFDSSMLWSR